eukprot:g11968.t1
MNTMPGLFDGTSLEQPVTCPACNKAQADCDCPRGRSGAVCLPKDQDARVRREKRRGKWVTVVTGLDPDVTDLKQLAKDLKAKCASGGSVTGDGVEVQGDHRDKTVAYLQTLGYPAKLAGDDLTEDDKHHVLEGIRALADSPNVARLSVRVPAGTPREVVDNSYDFQLVCEFDSQELHDAYQSADDEAHQHFIENYKQYWTKVPAPEHDEPLVERAVEGQAPDGQPADQANPVSEQLVGIVTEDGKRQIVIAGGCFWCVEAVYEQLEGVHDVESGYAGGDVLNANYQAVSTGRTKHAEVVRITYDPSVISYGTILKVFFTTAHDPTTLNRQGNDVGPQYRSAIFYATDYEKQIASDYIKQLNSADVFRDPIVTTLEPLEAFFPAETYHQDYAKLNPDNGYIQNVSSPKVEKTKKTFSDLIKEDED